VQVIDRNSWNLAVLSWRRHGWLSALHNSSSTAKRLKESILNYDSASNFILFPIFENYYFLNIKNNNLKWIPSITMLLMTRRYWRICKLRCQRI
jgi:hypothetical protein